MLQCSTFLKEQAMAVLSGGWGQAVAALHSFMAWTCINLMMKARGSKLVSPTSSEESTLTSRIVFSLHPLLVFSGISSPASIITLPFSLISLPAFLTMACCTPFYLCIREHTVSSFWFYSSHDLLFHSSIVIPFSTISQLSLTMFSLLFLSHWG